MNSSINSIAPNLRELEKSTLDKMHAAIHEKEMRNADRLLIFSHLIDRYIEARTKIVMDVNEEAWGQIPE
jgi:hypothetical protein